MNGSLFRFEVEILPDQKVVIQQVIDNSKVIKCLNSVKTMGSEERS